MHAQQPRGRGDPAVAARHRQQRGLQRVLPAAAGGSARRRWPRRARSAWSRRGAGGAAARGRWRSARRPRPRPPLPTAGHRTARPRRPGRMRRSSSQRPSRACRRASRRPWSPARPAAGVCSAAKRAASARPAGRGWRARSSPSTLMATPRPMRAATSPAGVAELRVGQRRLRAGQAQLAPERRSRRGRLVGQVLGVGLGQRRGPGLLADQDRGRGVGSIRRRAGAPASDDGHRRQLRVMQCGAAGRRPTRTGSTAASTSSSAASSAAGR